MRSSGTRASSFSFAKCTIRNLPILQLDNYGIGHYVALVKLGTRPRYALRMMLEIARLGGQNAPVSLTTVSGHSHLSRGYLEQLALALRTRGLLKGVCGKQGGYRLARGPDEITIGEIFEAAMGPLNIVECVSDPLSCMRSESCECRPVYQLMNRRITEVLHGFTLAQMLDPGWAQAMKADAVSAGPTESPIAGRGTGG